MPQKRASFNDQHPISLAQKSTRNPLNTFLFYATIVYVSRVIVTILHVHLAKIPKIVRANQLRARLSHPLHVENVLRFRMRRPIFSAREVNSGEMILVSSTRTIKSRTKPIWHRVPTQHSHVVRQRSIEIADVIDLLVLLVSILSISNFTSHFQTHHVPKRTHPSIGPSTPAVLHRRFSENLLRWVHQPAFFQRFEQSALDGSNVRHFRPLTGEPAMRRPAVRHLQSNLPGFIRREIERPFGCCRCFLLLLLLLHRLPLCVVGRLLLRLRLFFVFFQFVFQLCFRLCRCISPTAPKRRAHRDDFPTTTMNPSPTQKTTRDFCAPLDENKARSKPPLSLSLCPLERRQKPLCHSRILFSRLPNGMNKKTYLPKHPPNPK